MIITSLGWQYVFVAELKKRWGRSEKKHMLHARTVLDLAHHGHLNTKPNKRYSKDTIRVGRTLRTFAACCKVKKLTPALNKQIVSSYYTASARQCASPGSASMIHVSLMCLACNCWSVEGRKGSGHACDVAFCRFWQRTRNIDLVGQL